MKKAICIVMMLLLLTPALALKERGVYNEGGVNKTDVKIHTYKPCITLDEIVDQQQTHSGGGGILCGNWIWAQSFKPRLITLTKVEILLSKVGNPPHDIVISIKESLDGDVLASISLPPNEVPEQSSWEDFDFDDIYVTPNQTYFILFSTEGGDNKNNYYLIDGSSPGLNFYKEGEAWIWFSWEKVWKVWEPEFDFCFKTYGLDFPPVKPQRPNGPTSGETGKPYNYSCVTIDRENDRIRYYFDWGDGTGNWSDWMHSGETCQLQHIWKEEGVYNITVKAQDKYGLESEWSDPLSVSMPKSYKNPVVALIQKLNEWLSQTFGKEILPSF